jgi:endo-1,4-beta-mannosidase
VGDRSGADDRFGQGPVSSGPHLLVREGRAVLPVGAHVVPVEGPDWPWRVGAEAFDRAFEAMADVGLTVARIDLLWEAVEPEAGRLDERHLEVLDDVLAAARRHGIWLHPTLFVGGEVGDAFWDVPWRDGRQPHANEEMRRLQADHARALAERWRGDPALIAWDLTDEPPFWLFRDTTDDDARAWTRTLVSALRAADPDHLVTIGTASQDIGHGPFRADVVAEDLDVVCVHPYPIYSPDLYPDQLLSPRLTRAAAFETALARGAGRSVMVHEYGASSAQFDPERIAAHDRLLTWSSFGRGAIAYVAWCWTDAEPQAYRRAPYVRQPHETQFGVTDHEGRLRPRGEVLARFARTVARIDLDAYAAAGPRPRAALIVPHEYVRPYDPASFGLDASTSGSYRPAETAWAPSRDVRPLVRGWLNAFVLAARAGMAASFPRESLEGAWPDVRLLLLPAPLASTSSSLLHVRTSFWDGAEAFFEDGGTLYISCSADVAIPGMDALAGCRLADRAPAAPDAVFRFVERWGPFEPGDRVRLPAANDDLSTRGVRLEVTDARVVAVDERDAPMLVVAPRGRGRAVVAAAPIELLLASIPDAHGPEDRTWGIYAGLADVASAREIAWVEHPAATSGVLTGERGGLLVATNHAPDPIAASVHLPPGAGGVRLVGDDREDDDARFDPARAELTLPGWGATILLWDAST